MKRRIAILAAASAVMCASNAVFADVAMKVVAELSAPAEQRLVMDAAGNIYGSAADSVFELSGPDYQTSTTLNSNLVKPLQLVMDSTGNLYGISEYYGTMANGYPGSVFELSGANHQNLTTLLSFSTTDSYGYNPTNIAISPNGTLYVTNLNGYPGLAIVSLSGPAHQTLSYSVGDGPPGALIIDAAGDVVVDSGFFGNERIISAPASLPAYTYTVLHTLQLSTEGSSARGFAFDSAGDLYGVLSFNGFDGGMVFELSGPNDQTFTILHSFNFSDGAYPEGSLTIDANGNLFGTTQNGGLYDWGDVYELSGANHQTFTTLYNFTGSESPPLSPYGGLIPDAAGNLYGVASDNTGSTGEVYELTGTGFAVVPEPSCFSIAAIVAIPLLRRRGN